MEISGAYCNARKMSPICPSISASSSLTDAKSIPSSGAAPPKI
jgi:hypothetical protein